MPVGQISMCQALHAAIAFSTAVAITLATQLWVICESVLIIQCYYHDRQTKVASYLERYKAFLIFSNDYLQKQKITAAKARQMSYLVRMKNIRIPYTSDVLHACNPYVYLYFPKLLTSCAEKYKTSYTSYICI